MLKKHKNARNCLNAIFSNKKFWIDFVFKIIGLIVSILQLLKK